MCKCLKLLCESKLVNVLCGKTTSNGLVSGRVSFYTGRDERKERKNSATLGAFNWRGYNKPSFKKKCHKSTREDCTFQINGETSLHPVEDTGVRNRSKDHDVEGRCFRDIMG